VLPRDVVVDDAAAERTGTVERVEGDEIIEALRLGFPQRVAHARTLELEYAVRLPILEDLVALRVVQRNVHQVNRVARRLPDVLHRVVEQGERAEAEEVHLEQANPLDFFHGPLRRDFVLGALIEGHELGQRAVA
jgi:hypothetical protein